MEVALGATPFCLRHPHYMLELVAGWDGPAAPEQARHAHWAHQLSQTLQGAALPGGYANLLGLAETAQNALAFGRNLPRLQQIKRTYDPTDALPGLSFPRSS